MEHVTLDTNASETLLYHVERPVYDEGYIEKNLLHKRARQPKALCQRLTEQLSCSSGRAKSIVFSFLPILKWLPAYPVKEYLFGDVVSGLSTGVMQLPQGLAYALLAAVPPVYGLYTSFYPVLLYTIFGTSRHTSIGTFAVVSLMIGGVVMREAPDHMFPLDPLNGTNGTEEAVDMEARDAKRVQVAMAVTCLVGIIQLVLGFLRFGFVSVYLTEPLVRGFTTAAALSVFISQLKYFLGIRTPRFSGPLSVLYSLIAALRNIPDTNVVAVTMGLICIVFLCIVKSINERFKDKLPVPMPGEFVVVIVSTGVSYGAQLAENYQLDIVGNVPSGLLPPAVPDYSLFLTLITDSIAIAIVSISMSISLAKIFALKHGYSVDSNQEMIALGMCNFTSSFFHCFTITSSMSRSLVQEGTGGKTQIAGLLASLVVLVVVVAIGFVFQPLPQTALAAIVMVNLLGMFKQLKDVPALWRSSRIELVIWVVAFIASVLLGLDYGLLVAVGFAVLTVIYRTQSPKRGILGEIPATGLYCDVEECEEASEFTGIKIFHFNMPIYFANSDLYVNSLKEKHAFMVTLTQTGLDPAALLASRTSHGRKVKEQKKERKERQQNSEGVKQATCVILDMERCGTRTLVGEQVQQMEPPANGQLTECQGESDPKDTHSLLEPLTDVRSIILDFTQVNFIDSVGAKAIRSVIKQYREAGIKLFLAGCSSTVLAELKCLHFFEGAVTPDLLFPSIHDAVLHCLHHTRPCSSSQV